MQKSSKQQRQATTYYMKLKCHHGNCSMACECAVTSVPDISVLGQFGPWAWLVC